MNFPSFGGRAAMTTVRILALTGKTA